MNRGPLAMGTLTGKMSPVTTFEANDVRGSEPGFSQALPGHLKRLQPCGRFSRGGRTLAQGALAWLWARSPHNLPIPGFKTIAQVKEKGVRSNSVPCPSRKCEKLKPCLLRSER